MLEHHGRVSDLILCKGSFTEANELTDEMQTLGGYGIKGAPREVEPFVTVPLFYDFKPLAYDEPLLLVMFLVRSFFQQNVIFCMCASVGLMFPDVITSQAPRWRDSSLSGRIHSVRALLPRTLCFKDNPLTMPLVEPCETSARLLLGYLPRSANGHTLLTAVTHYGDTISQLPLPGLLTPPSFTPLPNLRLLCQVWNQ